MSGVRWFLYEVDVYRLSCDGCYGVCSQFVGYVVIASMSIAFESIVSIVPQVELETLDGFSGLGLFYVIVSLI